VNSFIDTTVIFIFSAFVLGIGLLFARTGKNLKSFFAGGEAVPWFIGGLSLFMSFFSAGTFVAWGSIAYQHGWVAVTIQWTMCIGALVTGLYLAPRWKATGNLTAAEFIRDRLGERVQKLYIFIFTLVSIFIKGSVLYPVAKLVSVSLGFPLVESTIVLGVFMIAYTAVGGLWAVMVTDILQFVILSAAVFILLPLSLDRAGGFDTFTQRVPADFFDFLHGEYTLGFVLAFILYHVAYIGGNWTFVQRYTSVDSPRSARKVAFLFAGLYLISPVIWMLPPMIYRSIDPSLSGLDTENAYLKICQLVLPPGLLGLMLTGMYFSTSASANTALNVVSAVFTNDIYKGFFNPTASDKQLIRVARLSSWGFGLGMIVIALLVPAAGGIVNVVLSISAISGGPLLAPPLWALFSKRLDGRTTFFITLIGLAVNLYFKVLSPALFEFKLSRAAENAVGIGLPLLLLAGYEWYARSREKTAAEYPAYLAEKTARKATQVAEGTEEALEARKQNRFGLRVIAGSLVFVAVVLFGLSALATSGGGITAGIAVVVLLGALIPWRAARRVSVDTVPKPSAWSKTLGVVIVGLGLTAQTVAQTTPRVFDHAEGSRVNLNGTWAFRTDPTGVGETQGWYQPQTSAATWDSLPVPGNWDLRNEYAHYVGKGWYRRTFATPAEAKGKTTRLRFEAVYHDCTVWLNGQKLGENHSGFLPFEFEVSEKLNATGPNTLVVCADNTLTRGAIWNWGGIRRPVSLEITKPMRIVRQHVTPVLDLTAGTATVAVRVFLQNHGGTPTAARGTVTLTAPNGYRQEVPFAANVPARGTESVLVRAAIPKTQTHRWHFDDPFLYESLVTLTGENQSVRNRFGLRKVEVDNKNFTFKLNGESIRPMGFNLVPDDRTTGNTLPTWRIREDIDLLKNLGCQFTRLSHLCLPEEVLDYLDERGILVVSEIPLWGFDRFADPKSALSRDWMTRLVTNQYNHPSVVCWSVGNEIGDYPTTNEYVRQAIAYTRTLDSTRLVSAVTHTAQRPNDFIQFTDLGLINKYGKNLGPVTDLQHRLYPDKVLFYSEYGAGQLAETLDAGFDAKAFLDSLRNRPYLIGGSLWTFNDYRSRFFGTKEISENRPWGVVDVYRQKKRAYPQFRKEHNPLRELTVKLDAPTAATVTLVPRRVLDLPAFPLHGYRLAWKRTSVDGRIRQGGFLNLPDLRPGDAAQTRSLSWQPDTAAALTVELLAPTGDALADTTLFLQKPAAPKITYALGGRSNFNGGTAGTVRVQFERVPHATAYLVRYGESGLTQATPTTVSDFVDIPKLPLEKTVQVAVVVLNAAGEAVSETRQVPIELLNFTPPVTQHVEPCDGGFFLGYASEADDYLYRVQVSEKSGDYTAARTVETMNPGTLQVTGLTNGRPYFFRFQRVKDNFADSQWSDERGVTPDGGQPPVVPALNGVLRQGTSALVDFAPVPKATGYVLEYRALGQQPGTWQVVPVETAQVGRFFLTNLDAKRRYEYRLATRNATGTSPFSLPVTETNHVESRSRR
jgi:beta-galactosidase